MMEDLKKAVILAAKIHEESWQDEEDIMGYEISLEDAADQAAEQLGFDLQGTKPVYLLLKNSWNETLVWANG